MEKKVIEITKHPTQPVVIDTPGGYNFKLKIKNLKLKIIIRTSLVGSESQEYRLIIEHLAPNTTSLTSMKGVVDDQARLKFFGKILVPKGVSKVEAFLEQRVLVLSDKVKVETKPELEILNNDVVCSHAASIAPPDKEQVFYLVSRGLSRSQAVELIKEGFLKSDISRY